MKNKILTYKQLRDKFLELFNLNHLGLDLLYTLEEVNQEKAKNFILNKFFNELTSEELTEHLGQDYIKDYYIIGE